MANLNHRGFEEESRSFPDISSNEALHETVQIVLPVFLGYAYAGDGYCAGCQMAGICVDERLLGEWAGSPFIYTMLIGIRSE